MSHVPDPLEDEHRPGPLGSTGRRALIAVGLVLVTGVAVVTALQLGWPGGIGDAPASPIATPASNASPTPEATPSAPPTAETPMPSPTPARGELPTGPAAGVMSFVPACDVVPPVNVPATTVLEDGRVLWRDDDGRLQVRQLTAESLADFGEQVRSTGLFDASAVYELERRPGTPEPPGHGVCIWNFTWNGGGEPVDVSSVMWLGDQEEAMYYQPSPERETLHALAEQLMDPTAWYDEDGWVQPQAAPFEPREYLVIASVTAPQAATQGAPDVDEVSWPFDEPPDEFGVEHGTAVPAARCDIATAEAIEALAAELAGFGLEQFDGPAFHGVGVTLPWAARNAAVDFTLWPVLPDGRPACEPPG